MYRLIALAMAALLLAACTITLPEPPPVNLPTQPVVLEITPAPTLDIDATATFMADQLRPTATPVGLYVVQPGDTMSELATRFDTTVEEILVANELSDPNALQVGEELIIPSLLPTEPIATPSPVLTSTVIISPTGTITATQTP